MSLSPTTAVFTSDEFNAIRLAASLKCLKYVTSRVGGRVKLAEYICGLDWICESSGEGSNLAKDMVQTW